MNKTLERWKDVKPPVISTITPFLRMFLDGICRLAAMLENEFSVVTAAGEH